MNLRSLINRECFRGLSFQVCFAMLALGLVGGPNADAGIIVNINQVGADVVFTIGGSFTRPGSVTPSPYSVSTILSAGASSAFSFSGTDVNYDVFNMSLVSSPGGANSWGGGSTVMTTPSSSSLTGIDRIFAGFPTHLLSIASDYVDNTPINGTMTFTGKTLTDLNITNLGTFSYNVTGSVSSDTFVVNISAGSGAAVPEPASLILLSSLGLVGSYRCYRRKSRRSVNVAVQQS